MTKFKAPTKDTLFVLNEVLDIPRYEAVPGYAELTPDILEQIVEAAGRFASDVVAPINAIGDIQGCTRHPDGSVTMPDGYKDAFDRFHEAGWGTLAIPESRGGQGLPQLLDLVMCEYLGGASPAFSMSARGPGAIFEVLNLTASPEMKDKYLGPLVTGKWTGTMNLTEPHCGTDLGLLRTRAEPQADGSYRITGNKIFISGGEHDLTANILHLVLARTPGAPASTKGISMFLVPKFLVNDDGSRGERNALSCSSIEHKMGLHGSPTCAMNYDGAMGWLVGEENKGLVAMFVLMNAARLSVGIQGLAAAEAAYQAGASYALDRRQGRSLEGPIDPHEIADPIIVHPDVRRMLMDARAFIAPMRALTMWCGLLVDLSRTATNPDERQEAEKLLALLTPIIKGFGTERGLQITIDMQQIWGGHGYIVENGVEQFVRDCRIALIYEGANGIQAMDLVERKLAMDGGGGVRSLFKMIEDEAERARAYPELIPTIEGITAAAEDMKAATAWLQQHDVLDRAAGSFAYLNLAGVVVLGLMWLRIAQAAAKALGSADADPSFYEAKLAGAAYFASQHAPETASLRRKIEAGASALMALPASSFAAG